MNDSASELPQADPRETMQKQHGSVFTPEQAKDLEKMGLVILELQGLTVNDMLDRGIKIYSDKILSSVGGKANPWRSESFRNEPSMNSQIAINPLELLLPHSALKTPEETKRMLRAYNQRIGIQGVEATVGRLADYVEMAARYSDRNDGSRLNTEYFITNTEAPQSSVYGRKILFSLKLNGEKPGESGDIGRPEYLCDARLWGYDGDVARRDGILPIIRPSNPIQPIPKLLG